MRPRVFNIAPGCAFLETFVAALYQGQVIPGFSQSSDPLELAKIRIYVPTRRAAHALAAEFKRQSRRSAILSPAILPLGALDDDGSDLVIDHAQLPRAVGDIERRMILGELILNWSARLKQAIVSIDDDGTVHHAPETLLVGTQPVDAWRLSGELAELIDDMIIENVAWKTLDTLNGDFDTYWRLTLHFLDIAIEAWPRIQQERGFVDPAARQRALIACAVEMVAQMDQPVIALGSTGSNVVTAQLLAAVAHAKRGAVILPGLDTHLDAASYATLWTATTNTPTHPQAFLARLIKTLGIERQDVVSLGTPSAKLAMREKFVSESFRPAETTGQWLNWRSLHDAATLRPALEDVALVEAANEREEALAIALCLREALEDETRIAALVTSDRSLARRVRAELLRWNIEIDDSGGVSLGLTSAGVLARLILKALAGGATDWAALLAHPLATFGMESQAQTLSRLFELGVLRARPRSTICWREAVVAARDAAQQRDAHPRQKALTEADWLGLEDYASKLDAAVAPLRAVTGRRALSCWLEAHRAAIGLASLGDATMSAEGDDGEALSLFFDELAQTASARYIFDLEAYAAFFDALVAERVLRRPESGHPRLQILGLLEARLYGATRFVLAGLDETVWPPEAAKDSLLNRPMRDALGLSSIDRRIGQTAHDFCQALGAREVILTRARKRGGAPTIASRFLQRMEALAGADLFKDLRSRGDIWLDIARGLDQSEAPPPLKRPDPKPPLELRPRALSVTRIETLRRDPYAIYARHILRLERLPSLDEAAGAREIGVEMHAVLERFCLDHPSGPLPPNARAIILDMVRRQLGDFADDPEFRTFRWPRLQKGIDVYLAYEADRRPHLQRLFVEKSGALTIPLLDGSEFRLTCKADRIEILSNGEIAVCDYKTGEIPTLPQIQAGFSPQLTLEAAMVERAAFRAIPAGPVTAAFYIPLGGAKSAPFEIKPNPRSKDKLSFQDLTREHFRELENLLNDFRDPERGYPARPFPQFASRFNEYDHLARTREWSIVGAGDAAEDA
ncbi:double-strand break repair protein AddB [Rhodoblastus sphagnicola]|uniref:Double-strand break repair protein AddB n=1 Tax=Rhodoblastus sphagnicola TaxID=333368 RepID=A0A2S6MUS8_9HYPH|nr:double-strand break repair protein AddB [Rhodoblastus sphagnicola]MBB4197109.1 ATP-dependent helicase/nuclease subunit B [Rhodoblastus sphagnicola]PPQ26114.1 double-strand break repair protein AddB [Rhodoblastus sphagnicola]